MEKPKTGIAVDASMRAGIRDSATGVVAWQGVDIATGEVLFKSEVYPEGTISLAEFAAILDGVKWVLDKGVDIPLYSDSQVARIWVAKKKAKMWKPISEAMMPFAQKIWSDTGWLEHDEVHSLAMRILQPWMTKEWGENPADLGFKGYQKVRLYAVTEGRKTGIFTTWKDCAEQVFGYPGAKFEEFHSPSEAQQHLINNT